MNLETRVFNGELDIAIFVVNSKHYFIFDDKENYIIDIRTIYKDYLEKEIISHNQLLTKNNVFDYFDSLDISPRDKNGWLIILLKDMILINLKIFITLLSVL